MRLWVSSCLAVSLLLACVSDNGPTGPNQGELGGPCFANNTCKDNLVCTLANGSAVCQQPDGSSSDAVADQGGDGATPCTEQGSRACTGVQCAGTSTPECCAQSTQCVASSADCNSMPTWTCTAKSDCSGGAFCCIAGAVSQASACPQEWMVNGGASCSVNECSNSFYEVCSTSSECPPSHPTCTAVHMQGIGQILGLCL